MVFYVPLHLHLSPYRVEYVVVGDCLHFLSRRSVANRDRRSANRMMLFMKRFQHEQGTGLANLLHF